MLTFMPTFCLKDGDEQPHSCFLEVHSSCLCMQSNPFGSAKPVDTVARLKELEERDAKRKVDPHP